MTSGIPLLNINPRMQSMSCKKRVMKEVDAILSGKSLTSIEDFKSIVDNNCPNLKEREEVFKEAEKKIENYLQHINKETKKMAKIFLKGYR